MNFEPLGIYHVYNRGHNRKPIFFEPRNYNFFLEKVKKHFFPFCDILCYCLMPNHFHFLVQVHKDYPIAVAPSKMSITTFSPFSPEYSFNNSIGKMLSSYAQAINNQENRIGALFQEKTKAKSLYEGLKFGHYKDILAIDPIVRCFSYIHNNPLEANLVRSPEQWEYSSFKDYLGLRNGRICNKKLFFKLIGRWG